MTEETYLPGYPHFEVKLWSGRLHAPSHLRRTSVGRLFESGRIGGSRITETKRFDDTAEGRAELVAWARRHFTDRFAVEYIVSPRRTRIPVPSSIVYQVGFALDGVPQHLAKR